MNRIIDSPMPTQLKISALWASTMFCYIYCDYFELYTPGKLDSMQQGDIGPGLLVVFSVVVAIPSLMVFLSVALPVRLNRILNIGIGAVFTLMMAFLTFSIEWYFYKFFAGIETVLTAMVVLYAWRWRQSVNVFGQAGPAVGPISSAN